MTTEEFIDKILPHYRIMYRVAASVMRSEVEAVDVVQDAMLRLYERKDQLNGIEDIKSYCIYVTRNVCLNTIRGRKDYLTIDALSDIESSENIHNDLEWRDILGIVDNVVIRLPSDQLRVFKLSAFGDFSNIEIADMLGITQVNVRVLLSRARKKIKELLSK